MALTQKKTKETKTEAEKKSKDMIVVPKATNKKSSNKDSKSVKGKTTKTISRKEAEKENAKKIQKSQKQPFFKGVREELGKVTWPTKKDMVKYSAATILFILFFSAFFYLIDLIMALLKAVA